MLQRRISELQADRDWLTRENERLTAKAERKKRISDGIVHTSPCTSWAMVAPCHSNTSCVTNHTMLTPIGLGGTK